VQAVLGAALLVALLLLAFETWVIYMLMRQQGRVLLIQENFGAHLATISRQLAGEGAQQPQGLEPGEPAPAFELPDVDGIQRKLADYLGRPLVAIFWSPSCSFCQQMAQQLAELPEESARVLLVTSGDLEANRQMAAEHGWKADMLVDADSAVFQEYKAAGTPTGYLIDAEGKIASPLAIGADSLLALIEEDGGGNGHHEDGLERALAAGLPARDVSESNIERDGLEAGTPAPDFELKDLDGKSHRLSDLRGKPVLIVFSDPDCGPCQQLAPKLEELHRERSGEVEVLMIGRGDPKANREKAREHGLTFPVLLQRRWEVSKKYAMFGTPLAYLVGDDGAIAADVAVGDDAILALVERFRARPAGKLAGLRGRLSRR
jgi:peroxiredoxin